MTKDTKQILKDQLPPLRLELAKVKAAMESLEQLESFEIGLVDDSMRNLRAVKAHLEQQKKGIKSLLAEGERQPWGRDEYSMNGVMHLRHKTMGFPVIIVTLMEESARIMVQGMPIVVDYPQLAEKCETTEREPLYI